jgi:hypothetical protein
MGPQYYSSVFGGYNVHDIVQPLLRLSQAFGTSNGFFNSTTFFFMMEGGVRVTPIRYKFRPYFISTVGFYLLNFDDFGSPIFDGLNFTYTAAAGSNTSSAPAASV